MSWGTLTLGALSLKETYTASDTTEGGQRHVALTGRETTGWASRARLREIGEDLLSLEGQTMALTFSNKTDRSGYYRIDGVSSNTLDWGTEGASLDWALDLAFLGADNAVEVESRMAHVLRANPFSIAGERWHAPAIGHTGYYVGSSAPGSVVRTGADGAIRVYRNIPAVNPRWSCPVGSYGAGRSRLLSGGTERIGTAVRLASTGWELNNGLVRVRPATSGTASLLIAFWDSVASTWRERAWDFRISGDTITTATHVTGVTILRNTIELVTFRIVAQHPSVGRVLLDLSLRRGARFLEGHAQRATSGVIAVVPDVTEASTLNTGYILANAADANGVRLASGSSKAFTLNAAGGPEASATTSMDFWVGAQVPGGDAADTAANLAQQYMSVSSETMVVVSR